jgi:hypothetical protein
MCTELLPPGGYPIAVNKYIISYHKAGGSVIIIPLFANTRFNTTTTHSGRQTSMTQERSKKKKKKKEKKRERKENRKTEKQLYKKCNTSNTKKAV